MVIKRWLFDGVHDAPLVYGSPHVPSWRGVDPRAKSMAHSSTLRRLSGSTKCWAWSVLGCTCSTIVEQNGAHVHGQLVYNGTHVHRSQLICVTIPFLIILATPLVIHLVGRAGWGQMSSTQTLEKWWACCDPNGFLLEHIFPTLLIHIFRYQLLGLRLMRVWIQAATKTTSNHHHQQNINDSYSLSRSLLGSDNGSWLG